MRISPIPVRMLCAALLVAVLPGCGNLAGVRQFAGTASEIAAYKDLTHRYVTIEDRLIGAMPVSQAGDRKDLEEKGNILKARLEPLNKLHDVITGYMAALASLADTDAYSVSGDIDNVSGAINAIPELGLNADHVNAFGDISKVVSSWIRTARQTKDVKAMVIAHGRSMDVLLEGMSLVLENYEIAFENENRLTRSWYTTSRSFWEGSDMDELPNVGVKTAELLRGRRELVLLVGDRSNAVIVAEQDRVDKSLKAAQQAIKRIRAGHQEMRDRIDAVSSDQMKEFLLKSAADLKTLKAAMKAL